MFSVPRFATVISVSLTSVSVCLAASIIGERPDRYVTPVPHQFDRHLLNMNAELHNMTVIPDKNDPSPNPSDVEPVEPAPADPIFIPVTPKNVTPRSGNLAPRSFTYRRGSVELDVFFEGSFRFTTDQLAALESMLDQIPEADLQGNPAPELRIRLKTDGMPDVGSYDIDQNRIYLNFTPDSISPFGILEALGNGVGSYIRQTRLTETEDQEWQAIANRSFVDRTGFQVLYTQWLLNSRQALMDGLLDVNRAGNPFRLSGVLFMASRFMRTEATSGFNFRTMTDDGLYAQNVVGVALSGEDLAIDNVVLKLGANRRAVGAIVTSYEGDAPVNHFFSRRVVVPASLLQQAPQPAIR